MLVFAAPCFGASQGPNSPGTAADDAVVGTESWANPNNSKVSDGIYATTVLNNYRANTRDKYVQIVKSDGSIGSANKAASDYWVYRTDTYASYGGPADLWGESWDADKINDADFGVVISAYSIKEDYAENITHYLRATNFGFSIPAGATINGIFAEVEKQRGGGGSSETIYIDHVRMTVYYTEATPPVTRLRNSTWRNATIR